MRVCKLSHTFAKESNTITLAHCRIFWGYKKGLTNTFHKTLIPNMFHQSACFGNLGCILLVTVRRSNSLLLIKWESAKNVHILEQQSFQPELGSRQSMFFGYANPCGDTLHQCVGSRPHKNYSRWTALHCRRATCHRRVPPNPTSTFATIDWSSNVLKVSQKQAQANNKQADSPHQS